ncbi:MAG: TonB-dependent receptor [Woeseiaceae bacterium]
MIQGFAIRHFVVWLVSLVWLMVAASSLADDDEFKFEIPSQRASAALNLLGQQSNEQILYLYDEVQGITTQAVIGKYTLDVAIARLLRDTELVVQRNERGVLAVSLFENHTNQSGVDEMNLSTIKKTGLLASLAALFAAPAGAQNDATGVDSLGLEEITVTARRIKENLQDVPVAISAFTADTLERRQIFSSNDLGKITPNLQFANNAPLAANNNSSVIFIRGVGQISPRSNTDPGVGLYIDDVYMGQSVGGTMEIRDIAGIQVIRGPQGTLFGRNTIGGAVLLSTTAPGDELGGELRLGAGEDGLIEAFGAIDLPVSDVLKTRFSLGTKQQDGYVIRVFDGTDLGDMDNTTFMAKAVYEPSDTFQAKVNFDYTTADENGASLVFAGYNNNTVFTETGPPASIGFIGANQSVGAGCLDAWVALPGPPGQPLETAPGSPLDVTGMVTVGGGPRGYTAENNDPLCANDQWAAGPYANSGTFPTNSSLDNWGLSLNMSWDLSDAVTLKSITSYRELEWTGSRDGDNTPFTILHTDFSSDGEQFSQEFQLNYSGDRMTSVAGVYYYDEKIDDVLIVSVGDRSAASNCDYTSMNAGFTVSGTYRCYLDSDNNIVENDSWAVFAHLSYDFTDAFSGSFGVRYTNETKASTPDQFDYANPSAKYLPNIKYSRGFSDTTISASLSYRFSDATMVYASYAEGFKGGGWNSTFNFPVTQSDLDAGHTFDQEEVETIEVGLKSDLTDNFRVNVAVFTSDYTDLQFTYRVLIAPWFFNAGKASIDGAEVEFTWLPSDRWIVEGGIGILNSSIDETADISVPGRPVNTSVAAGNQLPFAPDLQWNLGIGYNGQIGSLEVSPRVGISYNDKVFFDAANNVQISQLSSYTLLDFSIAITKQDSTWEAVVGVNNATDEEYRVSGNSSWGTGTGYAETANARGRVIFGYLTFDF